MKPSDSSETRFSKQLSIFWFHSKRCMWGQQWASHKSDCTSVISMVQSVLTVAWPETHIVPGMGSPAPDTTLLEFTPRGNSTHTITADVWGWRELFTPSPVDVLALKVTSLWRLLPCDNSRHMTGRGYVRPISVHMFIIFLFCLFLHLTPNFTHFLSVHTSVMLSSRLNWFLLTCCLQQTIQTARCSPWQRRAAVQRAANWWLVY